MELQKQSCDPDTNLSQLATKEEIDKLSKEIENWELLDNEISRTFNFSDFSGSIRFINLIAKIADDMDHHPRITNVYNWVKLDFSTHETRKTKESGLTKCDFIMAAKCDNLFSTM